MKYLTTGEKILFCICMALVILGSLAILFFPTIGVKERYEGTDMTVRIAISPWNAMLGKTEVSPKIQGYGEEVEFLNKLLSLNKVDFFDYIENSDSDMEDSYSTFQSFSLMGSLLSMVFIIFSFIISMSECAKKNKKELKTLNACKVIESFFSSIGGTVGVIYTIALISVCWIGSLKEGQDLRIPDIVTPIGLLIGFWGIHSIFNLIYKKGVSLSLLETNMMIHQELIEDENFRDPTTVVDVTVAKEDSNAPTVINISTIEENGSVSHGTPLKSDKDSSKTQYFRDNIAILSEYKRLLEDGVISEEEYEKKRKDLLNL